jgi:hypothetical protein
MTYADALRAECDKAGASYEIVHGGRHAKAHISLNGKTRFVVYPASPSDSRRGALNFAGDVRRVIKELS